MAIACGPEAESEAVDWVLGKGPIAEGAPEALTAAAEAAGGEGGSGGAGGGDGGGGGGEGGYYRSGSTGRRSGGGGGGEGFGAGGGDGVARNEGAGDEESVDTMELIGSEAARAIELKDTGSSKRRKLNNFMAAGQGRAAAAAAAGGGLAAGAAVGGVVGGDVVVIDDDDEGEALQGVELKKRVDDLFQQLERLVEGGGLDGEEMEMVEQAERERVAGELSRLTGISETALQQSLQVVSGEGGPVAGWESGWVGGWGDTTMVGQSIARCGALGEKVLRMWGSGS